MTEHQNGGPPGRGPRGYGGSPQGDPPPAGGAEPGGVRRYGRPAPTAPEPATRTAGPGAWQSPPAPEQDATGQGGVGQGGYGPGAGPGAGPGVAGPGAPGAGTVYSARELRARGFFRFRRPRVGGKRPWTWRRVLKWTALGMTAVLVVVIALATTAYFKVNGDIKTFSEAGASTNGPGLSRPAQTAGQNILLVGSDSRADGNNALGGGQVTGANSDTTMLLHLSADGHHVTLVSIPRDTLTTIPQCLLPNGSWTSQESMTIFNSAFGAGGTTTGNPVCTQNTVEKMTGIRIDHTIVIDFEGVGAIASAVGGVQVTLPNAVNSYGINLPAGTYKVSGKEAVAYVRVRHGLGDGSDIGRMQRQQQFMMTLFKDILDMNLALHPIKFYQLSDSIAKAITVDPGLGSAANMIGLAWDMRNMSTKNMTVLTMPWSFDGPRVLPKEPDASRLWTMIQQDQNVPAGYN